MRSSTVEQPLTYVGLNPVDLAATAEPRPGCAIRPDDPPCFRCLEAPPAFVALDRASLYWVVAPRSDPSGESQTQESWTPVPPA